jgi:hypothetical protein
VSDLPQAQKGYFYLSLKITAGLKRIDSIIQKKYISGDSSFPYTKATL